MLKKTNFFIFSIFLFLLLQIPSFAQDLTENSENILKSEEYTSAQIYNAFQKEVDDFMTLRMNLASYETPELALEQIDFYCNSHFSGGIFTSFSDEEKLVLENFKTLEQYNYLIKIEGQKKNVEKMIDFQYEKVTSWISSHKKESMEKWLYATAADLLSCHLNFASVATIMRDGLRVKKYYEKALEEDENMSYALTNLGQWYYFSPHFCGGSKSEAKKCFQKAVYSSKTDAELYFAKIFLSQILFDEKETKVQSEILLSEADSFLPGGTYIAQIKKINSAGYSLLQFNAKRMSMSDI